MMTMMRRFIAALTPLLVALSFGAAALDPVDFDHPAEEARYRALVAELRCLVCQNQTVAESNAPLAVDLREQVEMQIKAGATDDEIIDYLLARYGDFVLYRPRFTALTALLWLAPALMLLGGGLAAWRLIRVRRNGGDGGGGDAISDVERERIRALLEDRNA